MLAAPRLVLGQPAILEPSVESGATDSGAGGRFVDGQPILRHQTSLGLRLSTRCSTYRIRSTATLASLSNASGSNRRPRFGFALASSRRSSGSALASQLHS